MGGTVAERHVVIRGHVFTYNEKAPFVVSGVSTLGAVEYDPASEVLRCHECGAWVKGLYGHIKIHQLSGTEYRRRHGLRTTGKSPLVVPSTLAKRFGSASFRETLLDGTSGTSTGHCDPQFRAKLSSASRQAKQHLSYKTRGNAELRNETGRCQAQTLFRIQVLAAQLGHTPSSRELEDNGICRVTVGRNFGTLAKAIEEAGLIPYDNKAKGKPALPDGFPSKEQLLESRMPWPKEYFGLRVESKSALSGTNDA